MHGLSPEPAGSADSVSAEQFARLLARIGPFEPKPTIAVAVSGGSDSMALALLLDEWASHRDARIEAITVDHGLRAESATEAEQVGRWLSACRVTRHTILRWSDPKPDTGLQAAARAARYRLMTAYCRTAGILHLCVAHHLDDQVETRAMRAARQSGPAGLAGMDAIRELDGVRLLRPLLGIAKRTLQSSLRTHGQAWIDDPSNSNPAFERVRLRGESAGDDARAVLPALHRAGLERHRLESESAGRLCADLTIHEAGWASLDPALLSDRGSAAALALAGLLQTIGGTEYPIAPDRREEALDRIANGGDGGFTLGGCHLSHRGGRLVICRDWGAIGAVVSVHPGMRLHWDGRFSLAIPGDIEAAAGLTIARLGERGIQSLAQETAKPAVAAGPAIPVQARKALPALWQGDRVAAVPHLGVGRPLEARFRPLNPATSSGFTVAY